MTYDQWKTQSPEDEREERERRFRRRRRDFADEADELYLAFKEGDLPRREDSDAED